jgi:hypothetical protein
MFLLHNTVMNDSTSGCYILGYHSATGSPAQTYGVVDWDSTGAFQNTSGASIASHEMGDWLDDPLVNNRTSAWGDIGQVSGCQSNLEVGDPWSGAPGHQILMNISYIPSGISLSLVGSIAVIRHLPLTAREGCSQPTELSGAIQGLPARWH